ncbi:MAG TPA: FtsX-like permease family protein [Streptosporangiaceae bacterium]
MTRFGLRLTLRGGREGLVRLIVTAVAVAIGVTILLAVLADFNAFRTANGRPCWECTAGPSVTTAARAAPAARAELWNYGDDVYAGQTIERLSVAALGPGAPVPPGISALPRPGQYYASPALAALLRRVPRDELGDRFPGTLAGTIGERALSGPAELVSYVGRTPAQLAALPQTIRVTRIAASSGRQIWSPYFRDAFGVAALAFLFPILILIGTATRLAAARLEERYAALRLVGATTRQVSVVAAVDAFLTALLGAVAGIAVFALLRPVVAGTAVTSARYFPDLVTLTALDYAAVLLAIPAAAAIAALLSLRRVRISPLGVTRRVTPPAPPLWRVLPLVAGVIVFAAGVALTTSKKLSPLALLGLIVIMAGLIMAGPWLTARAARLLGRPLAGASSLLAARRLADNPQAAFRAVRGLVLAVFLGTLTAGLLPAVNAATAATGATALRNVLLDQFIYAPVCGNDVNCTGGAGGVPFDPSEPGPDTSPAALTPSQRVGLLGLPPQAGATLLVRLRAIPGTATYPIYSPNRDADPGAQGPGAQGQDPGNGIMTCASLRQLRVLGQCAPGLTAVAAGTDSMYGDNPSDTTQPFVSTSSPAAPAGYARLSLQAVLVKVASPAVLERVRTVLATRTPLSESGTAPRTFGEEVQARLAVGDTVERLVYIAVALTLLVAGCSLAVTAGGGLVERKRPFSLLRVAGTPAAALYRVVLLETVLPLAVATVVAGGVAWGVAVLTIGKLASPGTPVPVPGHTYFLLMGTGLAVSLAVILATLPLLSRMTGPASARFE